MILRLITALTIFFLSFLILITSIFRTAQIKYDFQLYPSPTPDGHTDHVHINYILPPTNHINPTHLLWPIKALKDKLWLAFTTNPLKKAQINLFLSNNRLVYAQKLVDQKQFDQAVVVLEKSELYLRSSFDYAQKAQLNGMQTSDFLYELSLASLKHREVLESFLSQSPEDAKPIIIKNTDHAKYVFESSSHLLNSLSKNPPNNPFDR